MESVQSFLLVGPRDAERQFAVYVGANAPQKDAVVGSFLDRGYVVKGTYTPSLDGLHTVEIAELGAMLRHVQRQLQIDDLRGNRDLREVYETLEEINRPSRREVQKQRPRELRENCS